MVGADAAPRKMPEGAQAILLQGWYHQQQPLRKE